MAKKQTRPEIEYTPTEWTPEQLDCHRADSMEEAFLKSSRLAGGWYRRAVTIDWQVTETNDERYMIRPAEVAALDGWSPCYTVTAHV
jgi:hypothetical protein